MEVGKCKINRIRADGVLFSNTECVTYLYTILWYILDFKI